MENRLVTYFSKIMPLSEEEKKAIVDSMCIQTFKKGTVLLNEGQVATECYFVLEGCVRQYYLVEGEERTSNFFTEDQWVISINSFTQQVPADHYFICNEDTTLVVGNEQKENDLYDQFAKFESISRSVMEKIFGEHQEFMSSYITDTPEQRYLKLLQSRPELFQRVPQYQLASFIGVKPESLSRIRKRIAEKAKELPARAPQYS